jgi:hypothetical protein
MDSEAGIDPGTVVAIEASRRLERRRRAALSQRVEEKRYHAAAELARSLLGTRSEDAEAGPDAGAPT